MRVVFAGGAWLGSASLHALLASRHDVVGVLNPGLRRSLRTRFADRHWEYLMFKCWFRRAATIDTRDVPAAVARLSALEPDVIVSCGFPRRIPMALLRVPRFGGINIHPSLLPRYRGPDPIFSAILAGETTTGVSFHGMEEYFDTGPVYRQVAIAISETVTRGELVDEAANVAAENVVPFLEDFASGILNPTPQSEQGASQCGRITEATAQLDWHRTAAEIIRQFRAHGPDNFLWFEHAGRKVVVLRLRQTQGSAEAPPGTIVRTKPRPVVATGEGNIILDAAIVTSPYPRPWPTRGDTIRVGTGLAGEADRDK